MLSRCKGKTAVNYVRCIAIPAPPSSLPRLSASKEQKQEKEKEKEEEVWDNVLKAIPTSTKWQTLASQRRKPLDPNFFSSRRLGQSRKYTTDARQGDSSKSSPDEPGSLFNSQESAWDHVFDKIDDLPPLSSMPSQPRPRSTVRNPPGLVSARRQAMTTSEIAAFNNMFNLIFEAVQKQQQQKAGTDAASATARPRTAADRRADRELRHDPLSGVGIGSGPEGTTTMSDLFGKLRRVSRKFRWSPQEDAELERKMTELELCESDQRLLKWAAKEVFDESARYEEAARQAVVRAETTSKASQSPSPEANSESAESGASSTESEPSPNPAFHSPLPLQPPFYPHLLAALIHTFRVKFHEPHLSLAIFEHARSRSIASYVFGCTVPAYNELLRTRWEAFRDLRGVADALHEMRANGIAPDAKTREFVEEVRREVGSRTVWQEERNIGTGEVLDLLNQIETLSREPLKDVMSQKSHGKGKKNKSKRWRTSTSEQWKLGDGKPDRHYQFGEWDFPDRSKNRKPKRSSPKNDNRPSQSDKLAFE